MTKETIDRIIRFTNTHTHINNIHITWFGGEPLLYPAVIQSISKELIAKSNINLSANIITNGCYLTPENTKLLMECNVNFIQVSIDGLADSHNQKKFMINDRQTFTTVIKNIDDFSAKKEHEIYMGIRINLDEENKHEYISIFNFLKERYSGNERIFINPAFIVETSNEKNNIYSMSKNNSKFSFYSEEALHSKRKDFIYPTNDIAECATRNLNSWVIDPEGDLYKCWEIIGNEEYKVGEINQEGEIDFTNIKVLNRYLFGCDPYSDNKCKRCFALPICRGGCQHKRIENKFNNKKFNYCSYLNDNIDEYLLTRYQLFNSNS